MITLTFEPTCPEQAALLGKFLPEYMRAGELRIEGAPEKVAAVVESAAAAVEQTIAGGASYSAADIQAAMEDKPAPKRTRAAKPAAATATEAAGSTQTQTSAPATADTSETKSQPAPTPTATTAATEQPAAASGEAVTLEQVRAKLASLSQAGKAADVKKLIADFGAAKLTDIPADKYGELMAAAEKI